MSKPTIGQMLRAIPHLGSAEIAALMQACRQELERRQASDTEPAKLYTEGELKQKLGTDFQAMRRQLDDCNEVRRNQAIMLTALENGARVVVTDHVQEQQADGTLITRPVRTIEPMVSLPTAAQYQIEAYQVGAAHAANAIARIEAKIHKVNNYATLLKAAAICDNGPRTRSIAQSALGELVKAVQNLNIVRTQVESQSIIVFPALDRAVQFWGDLRSAAEQFLIKGTDKEQSALAALVESNDSILAAVLAEFDEVKRRGREKGKVDPVTRSAIEALDAARRALGIPANRNLQYGEANDIRRQAINTMENTIGLTSADLKAKHLLETADRQLLSKLIKQGKTSPEIIVGDESSLDIL